MEVAALAAPAHASSPARAERAAQEFEALVIAQMLAPLFASVETPGLAGGGKGEKAFAGMLQEEYAKAIAARGGFGIADHVKSALIRLQSDRADFIPVRNNP